MDIEAAVSVENLSKTYFDGLLRRRFEALKGVTFDVGRGEVFGLLGPNGAGKTTLIKVLLGIVRKSGGQAQMLGMPAGDRRSRHGVGYLPEHLRIPQHHTSLTAMEYYGRLAGLSYRDVRQRRMALLEQVGLKGREKDSIKKYSKGMLQRLGLAQALIRDPDLLILDEPTDGLDPRGRSEIRQIISRLAKEGKTVFLNSHILQEVELVCDRVAILDKGALMTVGTVEEIAPKHGSEDLQLLLSLEGEADAIERTFAGNGAELERLPNGHTQVRINLDGQRQVDELVDKLRAEKISIIDLTRHRLSLEDVFLKIIDKESSQA